MRWPTITWLADELRLWNENTEFASAVFLNVWLSSDEYVIDSHARRDAECVSRGHIPGYKHRFNARELARQLIDDAKASCGRGGSARPRFTQAGTDDYAPETQRFYPQFYTGDRLNGLGRVTAKRVRLDHGGYDSRGRYWGAAIFRYGRWDPPPLWLVTLDDGDQKYVRAEDAEQAKAMVQDGGDVWTRPF